MIISRTYPQTRNFAGIFDELFNSLPANVENSGSKTAPANISEDETGFHLELNVPGRNKEDFKLNIENGVLSISYDKKDEAETKALKSVRKEFSFSSFKRYFSLDEKINTEAIEAKYENGILNIYLPKKEEVKITPKQISVQ